jgi:DNA-directed RNA polymerase specialized sigma24 family protein
MGLAEKIAAAVEGLPPEQQEAIAKRMIDESLR